MYMKSNSLTANSGLSLSQAQSISNLCHQKARAIDNKLNNINNYSKTVTVGQTEHVVLVGVPIPRDIEFLLSEKSKLHACQAFLVENVKAKDLMLTILRNERADTSDLEVPVRPVVIDAEVMQSVTEDFGWSKLTVSEYNEFLEAEAYASHIGQFIHKDGVLDKLRSDLPKVPSIDWMTIKDGEKTPVIIKTHHEADELLSIHENLAKLHREYEQKVNYFKAKVKNLTTDENARIAKLNADAQIEADKLNKENQATYQTEYMKYTQAYKTISSKFEEERQAKIKEVASMRINIDARFQETIDAFLKSLPKEEN